MNADTLLKQANLLGTQASSQTGVDFTPINSSTLSSATPVALPTPTPTPNPAAPIIASAQFSDAQAQKQAEANVNANNAGVTALQNERTGTLSKISDIFSKITGAQTRAAEPNVAVDTANKELANLNTQIADVNVAYRGETDSNKGRGDITKEAQAGLQFNTDAKYGRQLADLAIRQSAANQNVTALTTAADRKLALTLAPLQTEVSYYKDFLLKNLDTLSTEEQSKVQQIITEKNRLIQQHTTDQNIANTAIKTALDNGVKIPDNVVAQITANPKDAYNILAKNGISLQSPLDAQLKLAQIDSQLATAAKTRADIINSGNVTGTAANDSISGDVKDVLEGRNTLFNIRQTMGRTNTAAAYMQKLRADIRQTDPNFDFVASDAGGKSVSSSYVQRATASINSVLPNIDHIVQLSDQVNRIGVKGVDAALQATKAQFGDKSVSNFHEAQKLIADEIGVALGAGTVSDMKLQLGFDVTDPSVTPEVFASNMNIVRQFVLNRLSGLQSLRYASSVTGSNFSGQAQNTTGNTTLMTGPDGIQYNVPNAQVDAFKAAGGK